MLSSGDETYSFIFLHLNTLLPNFAVDYRRLYITEGKRA